MIKFLQLPNNEYIHFKTPNRPGVSMIHDNDNILRKLAERIVKQHNDYKKGSVWFGFDNIDHVWIDSDIGKDSKMIGIGRSRSNLVDIQDMNDPSHGMLRDVTSLMLHPGHYLQYLDYRDLSDVDLPDIAGVMIRKMEKVSDVKIDFKRFSYIRYKHKDSFSSGVAFPGLGSVAQDSLVIITNILYLMYDNDMREDVDVILIEHTTQETVDAISKLFPKVQVIGSYNN